MTRSGWRAAVLSCLALAIFTPAAGAHAKLLGSIPAAGAVIDSGRHTVSFKFDDVVEAGFAAIRIYGPRHRLVRTGATFHPGGDGRWIKVRSKRRLAPGPYAAVYRVVAGDGHVRVGGVAFFVGRRTARRASLAPLLARIAPSATAGAIAAGARTVSYLAIAALLGGLAFLYIVWLPAIAAVAGAEPRWSQAGATFGRRLERLLMAGAIAGFVSAGVAIVVEGALAGGVSFWAALGPVSLGRVLATHAGAVLLLRLVAWSAILAAVALPSRGRVRAPAPRRVALGADGIVFDPVAPGPGAVLAGACATLVAVTYGLAGHAGEKAYSAVMVGVSAIHVVSMSVWLGGLIALLAAALPAAGALGPSDRGRMHVATACRFSAVALAAVAALLLTGIVMALMYVPSVGSLFRNAYGERVVLKVLLACGLIGLAAINRRRALPALRSDRVESAERGAALLRRTVALELAVIALVLVVTAGLVADAPVH
jgi:copper transport protein